MSIILLKIMISGISWLMLYFGVLKKPYLKLVNAWGFWLPFLMLMITSFFWGVFVGSLIDLLRQHV